MSPKFLVIIPGRNTAKWAERCLESVIHSGYPDSRFIWIDDASDDDSVAIARKTISRYFEMDGNCPKRWKETKKEHYPFFFLENGERFGGLANIYNAVHNYAEDDEICVVMGGDDWLYGPTVLHTLAKAYSESPLPLFMTYGNMISTDGKTSWAKPYKDENFRAQPALHALQPLTFRSKLFKKIRLEDLQLGFGWYPMAGDSAIMIPMLEMAGLDRVKCLDDILYVYNQHEQSDARTDSRLQSFCHWHVRQRPRYSKLQSLDDNPEFHDSYMGYLLDEKFAPQASVQGNALILLPDLGQDSRKSSYEAPVRRVGERLDLCVPFGKV